MGPGASIRPREGLCRLHLQAASWPQASHKVRVHILNVRDRPLEHPSIGLGRVGSDFLVLPGPRLQVTLNPLELNRTFSDPAAQLRSVAEREQCGSNLIVAAGEFNPPACVDSVILIAISPL